MATIQVLDDGDTFGVQRSKINSNYSNLNTDKAEKSNVITKDSTTVYTPSTNYHPANKLYADTVGTDLVAIYDPTNIAGDAFDRTNHTGVQAATTITQDSTHRFATDAEKTTWNAAEPGFSKNTAFNKNFGTSAGTVLEGDFRDTGKADKAVPASPGSFAELDVNGNLVDSTFDDTSFALDAEKVPTGGTTNQRLAKDSATNNDVSWHNPSVDYRDIITKTGASEIATSLWAGATVVHTPTVDAICTLPQTSTEALSAGFNFRLHNASTDKVITVTMQGSDTISNQEGSLDVQPGQTVFIQKLTAGSPNTWDMNGPTITWDDIVVPISTAKVPVSNAPTWASFIGNLNAFAYDVNDYQEFNCEILHGYKEGSDLELHVHWASNGLEGTAAYVEWEIEYSIADRTEVFTSAIVVSSGDIEIPASTTDLTHFYSDVGTITGTGLKIGAVLVGRVRRIASVGTAPSASPFLLSVGIHYQKDTDGSRTETAK
jgi:hypothetical protein